MLKSIRRIGSAIKKNFPQRVIINTAMANTDSFRTKNINKLAGYKSPILLLRSLDIHTLPVIFNGTTKRDPMGSGWSRPGIRNKNPAIVRQLFENFEIQCAVEIGVCLGAGIDILKSFRKEGAIIIGIDPCYKINNLPYDAKNNCACTDTPDFPEEYIYFIKKRSEEAIPDVVNILNKKSIPGIDFLIIDGDHSYRASKIDFLYYYPLLKKGGVIYWDDATRNIVYKEILQRKVFDPRIFKNANYLNNSYETHDFGMASDKNYDAAWIVKKLNY